MTRVSDDELRALIAAVREAAVVPEIVVRGVAPARPTRETEEARGVVTIQSGGTISVDLGLSILLCNIHQEPIHVYKPTVDWVLGQFERRWARYVQEIHREVAILYRNWTWRVRVVFSVDVPDQMMPVLLEAFGLDKLADTEQLERVCNKDAV